MPASATRRRIAVLTNLAFSRLDKTKPPPSFAPQGTSMETSLEPVAVTPESTQAPHSLPLPPDDVAAIDELGCTYRLLREELGKVIIGQDAGRRAPRHLPVRPGPRLADGGARAWPRRCSSPPSPRPSTSRFNRIQFTPDLMPADITGTDIIQETGAGGRREFEFVRGPVFANMILADEINRAPAKTQSALLEAMQEHKVTVLGSTYTLRAAVLRARHPEPDRAGRHLPAARSAARPLHVPDRGRLPERRRGKAHRARDHRLGAPGIVPPARRRQGARLPAIGPPRAGARAHLRLGGRDWSARPAPACPNHRSGSAN